MNRCRINLGDERGVAVVMALILLVALTGLVLAFLSVSAFEPQISANLASTSQARFVADAGLDWAFNTLASTPAGLTQDVYWNNLLAANGGSLSNGAIVVPGLTAASGTFSVVVRNDCGVPCGGTATDNRITGVALDGGGVANDTNERVIVASTATIGGAVGLGPVTRTISAVVRRVVIPPINAALAFPGRQADVNFSGSSFDIQGTDTRLDGTKSGAAPVLGISVSPDYPANEDIVENALQNNQQNRVLGKDEDNPTSSTSGANAINADDASGKLTMQSITDFVNAIKANADLTLTTSSGNTFSGSDIGATCANNFASNTCWGTTTNPKIVYVQGQTGADYVSVDLSGQSNGTGILIIENGRFEITGDFRWNGPVIVTGENVGIRYKGGGEQEVYGAVIVNETHDNGQENLEGDVRGNAKIYYSREAIDLVTNRLGRRNMRLYSWREQ